MTRRPITEQEWAVGALAVIAIIATILVIFASTAANASSGQFSISSPEGGFKADQSWFLFDGEGKECHVESWSDNPNRSLHDNVLITVDTNGTTTHLAVERFQGTTDRGLWDSTSTGEVYLQLHLGDDQRSSASYHAEWSCEEAPPSTSTSTSSTSTTEEPPPSSSTLPPDNTTTSAPPGSSSTTTTTQSPTTTTVLSPPPTTTVGVPTTTLPHTTTNPRIPT